GRMSDSTAILVLGMHRSGTSATSGWLHALGVNLGPYLMTEDPTQPKGYFEHVEIVGIHDELMAAFDSSYDDPRPLPEGWEHDHRVRFFREQLVEIIRRDLMTEPLWGVKDPRLCRLLPMWLAMLGDLGVAVRAICNAQASGGSGGIAGVAQRILRREERTIVAAPCA
ncbi:MAG TPA: hypothetical protein VIX12_07560, partial [Candidatus Binataceae bacterium]